MKTIIRIVKSISRKSDWLPIDADLFNKDWRSKAKVNKSIRFSEKRTQSIRINLYYFCVNFLRFLPYKYIFLYFKYIFISKRFDFPILVHEFHLWKCKKKCVRMLCVCFSEKWIDLLTLALLLQILLNKSASIGSQSDFREIDFTIRIIDFKA